MKDIRHSNVNGPDVEPTDAPVITSDVATVGIVPAESVLTAVIEAAFDAYAPQLKGFALAVTRDGEAADDAVQETFLRFVRHVRQQGLPDNIPGWLHRVCANLVISRGRRQTVAGRKKSLLVDRSVGVSAEDQVIRMDETARLRDALAELPADARAALLMSAAGFSSAEIGSALGRSANATSTYVCRARVRLREFLSVRRDTER